MRSEFESDGGYIAVFFLVQYEKNSDHKIRIITEQVPISLPSAASTLSDEETTFRKKFCLWTFEKIQFIRFENHMDRPRYLKIFLGYLIIYLSI